ncbi:MAG: Helix-turn-helix domain protein [Firmicutes bacterium ADurb.Bin182]|nr:MAG: Helix-turn-helix domain protein [Firmicutes bacterium ADurb.Bin182]
MANTVIKLSGEKELGIYMHPLRQKILRAMQIIGEPVTAKQLADRLCITPSSAKHHLTRLESIGIVEKHHTEQIHGITATYYRYLPVTVSIGLNESEFVRERNMIAENSLMNVYGGFNKKIEENKGRFSSERFEGDMLTGVVYLSQKEADELHGLIDRFIEEHNVKTAGALPFEYALVLYNASEGI